jgi:hypothetical protein
MGSVRAFDNGFAFISRSSRAWEADDSFLRSRLWRSVNRVQAPNLTGISTNVLLDNATQSI